MFSKLFSKESPAIKWELIDSISMLNEIDAASEEKPILLFKHSTSCPISSMALSRFERSYKEDAGFVPYFLDLIALREVSNEIASRYDVTHESPQAILITKGRAVLDRSHNGIDFDEINEVAQQLS